MPDRDRRPSLDASARSGDLLDAAFLRAVLEAIPSWVLRLDAEQRIRYVNRVQGAGLEQLIGRPVRDFIEPDDYPHYEEAASRALLTGEVCSYFVRSTREGLPGAGIPAAADYECHVVPIDDGDGRRGLCIVGTDISVHVKRQAALQASEQKLRIALEASGLGLWTWDVRTGRIEWDARFQEITGCEAMSSAEYQERLVHPDDRQMVRDEMASVSAAKPRFLEHRIIRPDGEIRWLLPCGHHTTVEGGETIQMIGGALDVTHQHKTTEQLRMAQKNDLIGNLASGIAHNFNNMLAIIQPALDLALQHQGQGAQHKQSLEDALNATQRAAELVGQLMTFTGQRRARVGGSVDLVRLVERTVSMCQRTFGCRVLLAPTSQLAAAHVEGDPASIEQVLVNILINARDAIAEVERSDACIRVTLSERTASCPDWGRTALRSYFCLRVEDNGVGMSDAVKERLFEPFFTTKKPGKGTGLALATSYGIVRDLGGFITVESQPLDGTSVSVFLPPAATRSTSARPASTEHEPAPCSKILVIDDEPAVRRTIELILRQSGHQVHLAPDGQAGVAQIDAGLMPDLIMLDRSMPGWSPRVTLAELRKRAPQVPVLFFTGQEVSSEERAQVQDVLYKPRAPMDLLRSVDRWLVATTRRA